MCGIIGVNKEVLEMAERNTEKRIEIYEGMKGEVVFDVDAEGETLWATRTQIAELFGVTPQNITMHMRKVFNSGELNEKRTSKESLLVQNEGGRSIQRKVKLYNLDAIISVGYRVNSKKATKFRIWATSVLKRYLSDGVAVNERRLKEIAMRREVEKLHDVESMMGLIRRLTMRNELDVGEATGILEVISKYAGSFEALKEYDEGHIDLSFLGRKKKGRELTIDMCEQAVEQLRASVRGSELFGKEKGEEFREGLGAILQNNGYSSVQEKAANLLYFVIKERPFCDGNKRIGSLLFILFLTINDCHLTSAGETKISDRALTAITLLIAESELKEKGLIVSLVCKLLE